MTSWRSPPVSDTARGMPAPSVRTWCFAPGRARSTRARAAFGPRRAARTCEESITARDQSSLPAAWSSASSSSCSRCHTPARFHSSRRRQQVIPDPNPSSWDRNSHWMPVCSTNKIPHSTCRSGIRLRPGCRGLCAGLGSSGSMRCHSPSGTIHGGCSPRLTAQHRKFLCGAWTAPEIILLGTSLRDYPDVLQLPRQRTGIYHQGFDISGERGLYKQRLCLTFGGDGGCCYPRRMRWRSRVKPARPCI